MRRKFGPLVLASACLTLAGCGGGDKTFANQTRPAAPVNLTVYINDRSVSVSPDSVGAGLVTFLITNRASNSESLQFVAAQTGNPVASTGPINPQSTAQVTVKFPAAGTYSVTTQAGGNDAAQVAGSPIRPAVLTIGSARPTSGNNLLLP